MSPEEKEQQQTIIATDMVQFFASFVDVVLQDYLRVRLEGNELQQAVAMSKIAQVSHSMFNYWRDGLTVFQGIPGSVEACRQANEVVFNVMDKKIDEIAKRAEALEPNLDAYREVLN